MLFSWFGKKAAEVSGTQSDKSVIVLCVRAQEKIASSTVLYSFKVVMGLKKNKRVELGIQKPHKNETRYYSYIPVPLTCVCI